MDYGLTATQLLSARIFLSTLADTEKHAVSGSFRAFVLQLKLEHKLTCGVNMFGKA
jgi:hypothetical protein